MAALRDKIDEMRGLDTQYFILGADWNFVENLKLDRKGGNPRLWQSSCKIMKDMVDSYDLVDI